MFEFDCLAKLSNEGCQFYTVLGIIVEILQKSYFCGMWERYGRFSTAINYWRTMQTSKHISIGSYPSGHKFVIIPVNHHLS